MITKAKHPVRTGQKEGRYVTILQVQKKPATDHISDGNLSNCACINSYLGISLHLNVKCLALLPCYSARREIQEMLNPFNNKREK